MSLPCMRCPSLAIIAAAGLAAVCLAQPDKPQPPPGQPAPDAAGAPRTEAPAWPEHKEKKLYADDFRGKKAPEFVIEEMLTDKPDRKGKVVLIDFWATWCGPCRKAIPELNEFQKEFKEDLVVIGVSDEKPSVVRNLMKKTEMNYAQAIDTKKRMSKAMNVRGIPHVIVISTDGVVRWQGFPLSAEEPLTAGIIKQIIEADPGVKERREKDGAKNAPKR